MRSQMITMLLALTSFAATSQSSDSYKSLLLYKFSEYIIWPSNQDDVKLGYVGQDALYKRVSSFAAKRDNMSVVNLANASQLGDCEMVFISSENHDQLKLFRAKIQYSSVLIVSELKDDIKKGADIVIFEEDGRMKYIMNEGTLKAKGLVVSKKLSSLGQRS